MAAQIIQQDKYGILFALGTKHKYFGFNKGETIPFKGECPIATESIEGMHIFNLYDGSWFRCDRVETRLSHDYRWRRINDEHVPAELRLAVTLLGN